MGEKIKLKKVLRAIEVAVVVVGIASTLILIKNPPKFTSKAYDGSVAFSLVSDTSLVNSNSELKLDVNLNPHNNPVSVLELALSYDPNVFLYNDGGVEVGSMLPVQIGKTKVEKGYNDKDNLIVTLIARCDNNGCLPALGPDKLISVKFKVLNPSAYTQISVSPITKVLSAANASVNADSLQYTSNIAQISLSSSISSTANLKPIADTYVKQRYPAKNYSNEKNIITSNYESNNEQAAYVKFDLRNLNGSINKAQLKLVPSLNRTVNKNFMIVTDSTLAEEGLTWQTQPGIGTKVGSYVGTVLTDTPILVELDRLTLQPYIGKMLTIKIDNVDNENNTLQIYSREVAQKSPELILDIASSAIGADLQAIDDTYVQSESDRVNNNYGESAVLITSNYENNNIKTAYIKFDASKVLGKTIKKATLQLTANLSRNVQKQIRIVSNTSWDEKSMTHNTKPAMGEIVGVISFAKNDLKIDTPILIPLNTSKIVSNTNGEISFGIDNSSSSSSTFSIYSKEATNDIFKPKLIIETY